MKDTITITTKGQTTLPVAIRRKLGLDKTGGVLRVRFDEAKGELIISKSASITELSQRLTRHIRPGIEPLQGVGDYYQAHREVA